MPGDVDAMTEQHIRRKEAFVGEILHRRAASQTHRLVELEQLLAEMHGDADTEAIGLSARPPPELRRREIELVRIEDAAIAAV